MGATWSKYVIRDHHVYDTASNKTVARISSTAGKQFEGQLTELFFSNVIANPEGVLQNVIENTKSVPDGHKFSDGLMRVGFAAAMASFYESLRDDTLYSNAVRAALLTYLSNSSAGESVAAGGGQP